MLKRINNTDIGDVFVANISEKEKKYFQYIVSDLSQLNSDVIRAFKKKYLITDMPDLPTIIADEVDFYAHCVTKAGIKRKMWEKVGNIPDVGNVDNIFFRGKKDCSIANNVQDDWYICKINDDNRKFIGKPTVQLMKLDWDMIVHPEGLIKKLTNGFYGGFYDFFDKQ